MRLINILGLTVLKVKYFVGISVELKLKEDYKTFTAKQFANWRLSPAQTKEKAFSRMVVH